MATAATNTPLVDLQFDINGLWSSSKACYKGVWLVEVADDQKTLTIKEQTGQCCGCIPNCIKKTHKMKQESGTTWGMSYTYKGRLGGKTVALGIVSENKMNHMTTDGLMTLTRDTY